MARGKKSNPRARRARRNPRVLREEVARLADFPGLVKVVRQSKKKGGILGMFGTKMVVVEPLQGGPSFKVPEEALVPLAENPVRVGELGLMEGIGPVKVGRTTRGGGFFGGPTMVVVEGPGIPGGVAEVPRHTIKALANPVYACPVCQGSVRVSKKGHLHCKHCGSSLLAS